MEKHRITNANKWTHKFEYVVNTPIKKQFTAANSNPQQVKHYESLLNEHSDNCKPQAEVKLYTERKAMKSVK